MRGDLFLYDEERKLVAFHSGRLSSKRLLIFLGGLTDGFLTVPYLENLSAQLESSASADCSLIQPLFRSSYFQYGWHSLDDDVEDLHRLIDYLRRTRTNLQSIVLLGHSTGCQDIVHYLRHRHRKDSNLIERVFLQGPVSDREYLASLDSTSEQMKFCSSKSADADAEAEEWLPRSLHFPPLTVGRCRSLNERKSIEDLFSTDLSDDDLKAIYANISVPIGWICSGEDEFVPRHLKNAVIHLLEDRLAKRFGGTFLLLAKADHLVTDRDEQQRLIDFLLHLL